jgi:hypothetical protein
MPRDERQDTLSEEKGKQVTKSDYLDFRAQPIEDAEPGNWKLDMRRGLDWLRLQCSCTIFLFFFL